MMDGGKGNPHPSWNHHLINSPNHLPIDRLGEGHCPPTLAHGHGIQPFRCSGLRERTIFVRPSQPAVSDDVGGEGRRELAGLTHVAPPFAWARCAQHNPLCRARSRNSFSSSGRILLVRMNNSFPFSGLSPFTTCARCVASSIRPAAVSDKTAIRLIWA